MSIMQKNLTCKIFLKIFLFYFSSLNPMMNKDNMSKIKESEGKSGSFFFFSHDGRFLIKTISNNELNTMIGRFMESYHEYMGDNPDSLIARVYGIYTVIIK